MARLFTPLPLRGLTLRNRLGVAPMCQYRAVDGLANDWHHVHLVSRAVGGYGLVCTEATAVTAEGRISPGDLGLYDDAQAAALEPTIAAIRTHGAASCVQLAHAGRKASTTPPWEGGGPVAPDQGGWPVVGPSPAAFDADLPQPRALTAAELTEVVAAFRVAAARSRDLGVDAVEVHAAHGYLLHSFLSPLTNQREDAYGGDLAGRARLLREVVRAIREVWPDRAPLLVRLSVTDWVDGGLTVEDSVEVARWLVEDGADLIDCSSGGAIPRVRIPTGPGYQVPLAARVRAGASVATAAVGLLTEPAQAETVLTTGAADLVLQARAALRDPYWPRRAAVALGARDALAAPEPYARGW